MNKQRWVPRFPAGLVTIAMVLLLTGSCKKKSNNNPFGSARLATVTKARNGAIEISRVVYDAQNNVDSIVITGDGSTAGYNGFRKFTYFGTSYSITDESGFTFDVLANASGQVLKLMVADTVSMAYNPYAPSQLWAVEVRTGKMTYPYYTITRTDYTWKDNDVVQTSTGTTVNTYDYEAGKNGQPGDAWRIDQFLNLGRSAVKTTRLVKDVMQGGKWREHYFYEYDGSGRINKFTKVGNNNGAAPDDTTVYSYSYY